MSIRDDSDSKGQDVSNYLEKINPKKDLVMFSPAVRKQIAKNDFSYLGIDYDIDYKVQEEAKNARVWGLPYINPTDPIPLGILGGIGFGALINALRKRPVFSSIQLHAALAVTIGVSTKITYSYLKKLKEEREMVIWDYVKKHPQDFPEVFNPPKKYKDLLLPWTPSR